MRIALVSPLFETVPPKLYGGTERVVSYLAEALVELGHNVTLFASSDSTTKARLLSSQTALRFSTNILDFDVPALAVLETVEMLGARAHEFDVISLHNGFWAVPMLKRMGVPFAVTLHNRVDSPALHHAYDILGDVPVVSISDSQRATMTKGNYVKTIHHGIPPNLLPLGTGKGDYLAFLGRIAPEKGVDAAIRIAEKAGMKLKIAAKMGDGLPDFEKEMGAMFDLPYVEYLGELNEEQKVGFLGNATAMLFPIRWNEPFGLVMVEAMSCGTPTIAMNAGSVPEVIDNGLTGYVVEDEDEAVSAIGKVLSMNRTLVRELGLQRFNSHRMAEDYVELFRQLIDGDSPATSTYTKLDVRYVVDTVPGLYLRVVWCIPLLFMIVKWMLNGYSKNGVVKLTSKLL